jgi:tRNA A37 threonylcarbamoyladenosine dehydratase
MTIGETPFSDRGRSRNILGSLPTITGIFGLTIANLAIFELTKTSEDGAE